MRSIRTAKQYNSGSRNSEFGFGTNATRMASTNPSPYRIRAATPADIDKLCELAGQLLAQIHAQGTAKDAQRVFERIMTSNDLGIILVAEHKTGLCGYAYATYIWRSEFGGETMHIIAVFTADQWRGKGVGRSLVSALLDNARQRGVHRVSCEVHPGNAAVERTLEATGFDPERRTLWGVRI
jgi:GNAT superfamily N-acetyltransferase